MIKKIKQKVANVIRELYTLKCGIAEVKRSQIAVVHLKTVNKKFNGQKKNRYILIFFFFYWRIVDVQCYMFCMYNIVIHNFEGYISNILNAYTGKMIVQILSLISFL